MMVSDIIIRFLVLDTHCALHCEPGYPQETLEDAWKAHYYDIVVIYNSQAICVCSFFLWNWENIIAPSGGSKTLNRVRGITYWNA